MVGIERAFSALALPTVLFWAGLASPLDASGQAREQPFEVALFSPVQIRGEETPIRIFRLSVLYGSNVSVKGLDVGVVSRNRGGISKGLQYSAVGIVDGDFVGWQNSGVAIIHGQFTGFQSGVYNQMAEGEAFQLGLVNRAQSVSGLQVGLVNVADNMYGLQIGLVNVIKSNENLVFFPIVNWSF